MIRPEWHQDAACRGMVDVFFAERHDMAATKKAKEVCARCPVFNECRDYITENNERAGVWAGQSADTFRRTITKGREERVHGRDVTYRRGCRCEECVFEARERERRYYRRKLTQAVTPRFKKILEHGKPASYSKGCRCESCRDAQRIYMKEYRLRKRKEAAA